MKFSKKKEPSIINITGSNTVIDNTDYIKIIISDNGIGFEQEQSESIFNTFTRLNPGDKYEGTGVGLALCKKIVERYNGTISADGEPNKGAVFTILFPPTRVTT